MVNSVSREAEAGPGHPGSCRVDGFVAANSLNLYMEDTSIKVNVAQISFVCGEQYACVFVTMLNTLILICIVFFVILQYQKGKILVAYTWCLHPVVHREVYSLDFDASSN